MGGEQISSGEYVTNGEIYDKLLKGLDNSHTRDVYNLTDNECEHCKTILNNVGKGGFSIESFNLFRKTGKITSQMKDFFADFDVAMEAMRKPRVDHAAEGFNDITSSILDNK